MEETTGAGVDPKRVDPAREAMRGFPHVLRGLGFAIAVSLPSCAVATCAHMDLGPPAPDATDTILVDRKVTPDGTELCITQALWGGGEPYTVRFKMRRPGETWKQFFLANDPYWIAEIKLLPDDTASVTNDFGDRRLFDWRHGRRSFATNLSYLLASDPNGQAVDDPYARER